MAGASSWKIERAVGGGDGAFARKGVAPTPPPTAPHCPHTALTDHTAHPQMVGIPPKGRRLHLNNGARATPEP